MIDTTSDRISVGAEAQAMLSRLTPYLQQRRAVVIKELLRQFHEDTLTEGSMRNHIASLAELQKLEDALTHKVRLGYKDAQELASHE